MIVADIPFFFLKQQANISWLEVKYGLERQLIKPKVAIEKAMDRLVDSDECSPEEIELAGLSEYDSVIELVESLASADENICTDIQAKWLYLFLAWLFNNQTSVKDPLDIVEMAYSDFDYPEEIAPFIRYMPMVGLDLGSKELNEARLYDYWKQYLEDAAKKFGHAQ